MSKYVILTSNVDKHIKTKYKNKRKVHIEETLISWYLKKYAISFFKFLPYQKHGAHYTQVNTVVAISDNFMLMKYLQAGNISKMFIFKAKLNFHMVTTISLF